ncbi:hypothetical protein SmJEL517_g05833 [Synchytrium microbalum]|uniref:ABC transporter domain-containing protein n=1 Tax=Synchytrium microbalum TaxID=1806994 RepID=A0A507BUE5_9FUNG|nr:uncharacterized protein SmJEL517_g05833 [Synchytrium microbalum]TPX30649.1 hypothetical protein SmJEL517_g05833 [Synchytrium microbalum]
MDSTSPNTDNVQQQQQPQRVYPKRLYSEGERNRQRPTSLPVPQPIGSTIPVPPERKRRAPNAKGSIQVQHAAEQNPDWIPPNFDKRSLAPNWKNGTLVKSSRSASSNNLYLDIATANVNGQSLYNSSSTSPLSPRPPGSAGSPRSPLRGPRSPITPLKDDISPRVTSLQQSPLIAPVNVNNGAAITTAQSAVMRSVNSAPVMSSRAPVIPPPRVNRLSTGMPSPRSTSISASINSHAIAIPSASRVPLVESVNSPVITSSRASVIPAPLNTYAVAIPPPQSPGNATYLDVPFITTTSPTTIASSSRSTNRLSIPQSPAPSASPSLSPSSLHIPSPISPKSPTSDATSPTTTTSPTSPLNKPLPQSPASPKSFASYDRVPTASLKYWMADAIAAEQGTIRSVCSKPSDESLYMNLPTHRFSQQIVNMQGMKVPVGQQSVLPSKVEVARDEGFDLQSPVTVTPRKSPWRKSTGGVELSWRDLNYQVQVASGGKHILHNLNGTAKPGELLAILGGSGAGKSTLMDVLSGRAKGGQVAGDIRFNNYRSDATWCKSIGYVQQEDIFWEALTVRETLNYGALLKLSESTTAEDRAARVQKVAQQMRLLDCLDSRIGDSLARGISGGEAKRLNIAMELLSEPEIMMLDEPTSGLDAFSAFNVINLLRSAAVEGQRTVMVSIHQPRKEILDLFDKVLIMARGQVLFFGTVAAAARHFSKMGHPVPVLTNPADHFLDMATFDTSSHRNLEISATRINHLALVWKRRFDQRVFPPYVTPPETRLKTEKRSIWAFPVVNWLWRVSLLMFRQWKIYLRDRPLIMMGLISNSIFIMYVSALVVFLGADFWGAFLFGILWSDMPLNQSGSKSRLGFFFMFGLNRFFTAIFGIVLKMPLRLNLYMRERQAGMYDGSMAFWALYFATWVQYLWLTTPTLTAVYFLVGLQRNLASFFIYFLAGNLVYLSGHTYGCLFGSLTGSVSGSLTWSLVLIGIFAGFAGYVTVPTSIPKPLLIVSWLDPLFFGFHAWAQTEFTGLNFTCMTTDHGCLTGGETGETILQSLSLYSMSTNVAIMMLVIVIFVTANLGHWAFERTTRPPTAKTIAPKMFDGQEGNGAKGKYPALASNI